MESYAESDVTLDWTVGSGSEAMEVGVNAEDKSSDGSYLEELRDSFYLETSYTEEGTSFGGEADESFLPLYQGSDVTLLDSHLMAFQFAICHGLLNKAFGELLRVISCHLPPSAKSPKSVHLLKDFFLHQLPQVEVTEKQYCHICHRLQTTVSPGARCDRDGCNGKFVILPLASQLKRMFEGEISSIVVLLERE